MRSFSEPAPKRGGMGSAYLHSPRDGPVSPRNSSGSGGSKSPSKSPSAKKGSIAAKCGGALRRGRGIGGRAAGGRGKAWDVARTQRGHGVRQTRGPSDDEDVPRLVGRPEKWTIAQHDLSICQWSGFGWAQCDVCLKWRKPSVSGVDLDVNENDRFVCSDMGAACPQVLS